MATKRRTDHEPRQPRRTEQVLEAAAPDEPRPGPASAEPANGPETAATAEAPAPPQAEAPAEPDRRIEELSSQLEEANSRHLRLAADFDNYKKRARQEQADTMRYATATVAERLLPVLDDADRALEHVPAGVDEGWLKGIRLTFQKLQDVLSSVGVRMHDRVLRPALVKVARPPA